MNAIGAFLRRSAQTKTTVRDEAAEKETRVISLRGAYRSIAMVQMATQLLIWMLLWLYADIHHTSWQAMLLMLVPAALLWLCWAFVPDRAPSVAATRLRLLLLPCLLLDSIILLNLMSLFCQLQLPTWPSHAIVLGLGLFTFANVAFSGRHGIPYGLSPLRWVLALFLVGSLALHGTPRMENLWPLWGFGTESTLRAALVGAGGVWGVALLFAMPREASPPTAKSRKRATLLWALLPIAVVTLWTLYTCALRPWPGSVLLNYKEKMSVLNWYGGTLPLFIFSTIQWLTLLPSSLSANAACATGYLCEAFPKLSKQAGGFLYLAPVVLLSMLPESGTLDFAYQIMPYRLALSAVAGIAITLLERRKPS